jgi:hypothetical protein
MGTHAEAKGFHRRFHFSRAGARRAVAGVGWLMFHLSHTVDYFGIGLTVYKLARSGKLFIPQTAVRHYCADTAPFRSPCTLSSRQTREVLNNNERSDRLDTLLTANGGA